MFVASTVGCCFFTQMSGFLCSPFPQKNIKLDFEFGELNIATKAGKLFGFYPIFKMSPPSSSTL